MKNFSVFDIIGPIMVGPSSSHTAGAARLGYIAYKLSGGSIKRADITLYGSFAKTGKGHGTDKAIVAGLLGMQPDEADLKNSFERAKEKGLNFTIAFCDEELSHPNSARIVFESENGQRYDIVGSSIGGGNIEINQINSMDVSFSCEYPTLLVFHKDKPGIITQVTGVLAIKGVNIAFMKVFRNSRNMDACMVIEMDTPIDENTMWRIKHCDDEIVEVCAI